MTVVVELRGLELPGRHGVLEGERETGQPFLYDVELELPEPPADELEETVDYREVVTLVRAALGRTGSSSCSESLAGAVADALLERFTSRARERPRAQAGGRPRRVGRVRRR